MRSWLIWLGCLSSLGAIGLLALLYAPVGEQRPAIGIAGDVALGRQLLFTAGCYGCHTDTNSRQSKAFAGGPRLATAFGDFYAPNITASTEFGIGSWSLVEFEAALRQGRSPQGHAYYPAFPFLSYRSLTDADVAHLYAALMASDPVDEPAQQHQLAFPYNLRLGLKPWRWLFATTESLAIDQSSPQGRGRYLVDAVTHCGECHTPRNALGAFIPPYLGGNQALADGGWAPAIHPRALAAADWTETDLFYFLADGILPDGDFVGGSMVEVIDYSTSRLSDDDRAAIAAYLFALP